MLTSSLRPRLKVQMLLDLETPHDHQGAWSMRTVLTPIVTAVALFGLAACSDSTATQIADDASISQDVAASAGDAASTALADMATNEGSTGLADVALPQGPAYSLISPRFDLTRTRTTTC